MVQFSDFRDSFSALPSGSLALDDVRAPEFCIYEDHRIVAYYAPFDYLNRLARVALVGVTPGPTQMRESYAIVRDALRAGESDQQALQAVKAHASFKGMRRDLARWLDELGLAALLGLRSCSELFQDSRRGLLHTTSAVRYPVFARSRDGTLANYPGSSPELAAHPWLRDMIETTLAGELSALPSAIVIPLGRASRALAHLQDQGAVDPARCLIGLPHPSPASPLRERYFQDAKAHLLSQVRHLAPDTGPPARRARIRRTRNEEPSRPLRAALSPASLWTRSCSVSPRVTSTTATSTCDSTWASFLQMRSAPPTHATGKARRSRCTSRGFPKRQKPTSQAARTSSAPVARG